MAKDLSYSGDVFNADFGVRWEAERHTALARDMKKRRGRFDLPAQSKLGPAGSRGQISDRPAIRVDRSE